MKTVTLELNEVIGVLKVNREHVLNALNQEVLEEFKTLLKAAVSNQLKILILTGAGKKAFIAGADVREMHSMTHSQLLDFLKLGQSVANALESAPLITIAAVNGYALGGGFEMALACDFIYASHQAIFGLPEVKLGIVPGFGGTQRLTQAIGPRRAKELILSGKTISSVEAKELGIVNDVFEHDTLIPQCIVKAKELLQHSFHALVEAKKAINTYQHLSFDAALQQERQSCADCFRTAEAQKAIAAFLNKTSL